jgi:hypothetical protein
MKYAVCLLLFLAVGIHLDAQSQEKSNSKSTSPLTKLFKKQNKATTAKPELKDARSEYRSSKKDNKAAAAREQAAREEIDVLKAQRKVDRTGQALETTEAKEKPLLGFLKKTNTASDDQKNNSKTDLKGAKNSYRNAKKERKVTSAKQQLAREQVDLLKAQKKVEKTERKVSKNNR